LVVLPTFFLLSVFHFLIRFTIVFLNSLLRSGVDEVRFRAMAETCFFWRASSLLFKG